VSPFIEYPTRAHFPDKRETRVIVWRVSDCARKGRLTLSRVCLLLATKVGVSPFLYKGRWGLAWRISISYPPYNTRFKLGQNSGSAWSYLVLVLFLPLLSLFDIFSLKFFLWPTTILARVSPLLPLLFWFCPFFNRSWLSLKYNFFDVALFFLDLS
jgi:hypothetical protein